MSDLGREVAIGPNEPGGDHTGGEFLLVEQRPRAQSRGTAMVLGQGQALVFTTRDRPVRSQRCWSASPPRHGVSTVRSGFATRWAWSSTMPPERQRAEMLVATPDLGGLPEVAVLA